MNRIACSHIGILLGSLLLTACEDRSGPGTEPELPGDAPSAVALAETREDPACLAGDAPAGAAGIATELAFPDLPALVEPVALVQAPGDTSHWYVVEKDGRVRRFANSPDADRFTTVVDIDPRVNSVSGESGLLGIAFHPGFATNGQVYLSYTTDGTSTRTTSRISRFTSPDGGLTLDAGSEDILLTLEQPYTNHNGGNLLFGPDGYLYTGFGDGGSSGDPEDRAQSTRNLFGSILRIDVDAGDPYSAPPENPFSGNPLCSGGQGRKACPEIYAWGFRNPWRWSFDLETGELWVADVGQHEWEEVDVVEPGGNYGWRCREGAHDYDTSGACPAGLIDPVIEYGHDEGFSITGGYVYRGDDIPDLIGRYVFADLNGKIFADTLASGRPQKYEVLLDTSSMIVSFAEDEDRELLFLDYADNVIRRIVPGRCEQRERAGRPHGGLLQPANDGIPAL